jgi:hypothetical protein
MEDESVSKNRFSILISKLYRDNEMPNHKNAFMHVFRAKFIIANDLK